MAVSTVFLQTTEDEANTFSDTTFHIDLPMLLPTYKLSIATFMFRPSIILGEDEYIKVRFKLDRDASIPLQFLEKHSYKVNNGDWGEWTTQFYEATIPVGTLEFSAGFDSNVLSELITKNVHLGLQIILLVALMNIRKSLTNHLFWDFQLGLLLLGLTKS